MPVKILWETVEIIPEASGHGVEIYYAKSLSQTDKLLIAFIVEFKWLHGISDNVMVHILSPESEEFAKRGLDGSELIAELKKSLIWYLHRRKIPLKRVGKIFVTGINA